MENRPTGKVAAGSEVFTEVVSKVSLPSSLPSWLSCDWFLGLILVLANILVYQPVWYAGFVWDDDTNLTANPCIVGPLGLKQIWTVNAGQFFPLVLTTFWVEHALWGLAPLPYHLVNVLLHGVCAVLLWRVLRSLQVPGAWLGAALWALHPVQVESVAWITETKNTQSGLFYLLAILFFVRWLKAKDLSGGTGAGWNYALTLLFAALAMASKSSTVVLPVVLGLCAWWLEGKRPWGHLLRLAPIFLMAVVISAWSIWMQRHLSQTTPWIRSWPERIAGAGDVIWFYLGKLVWPHPLIVCYPGWEIDAGRWISYLPLLAVIIVLVILWLKLGSWSRPCFFVFAYFLAALLPVLRLVSIVTVYPTLVGDHFQYLASMGPLALAAAGMVCLVDYVIPGRRWLQSSLYAGVLLVLGISSWQRTWAYESNETLWTDTLASNPNCWVGYYNLGCALLQKGEVDEAMTEFQKTLGINPNLADAHYNFGNALLSKGQVDAALVQFQKALEIDPNHADTHINFGNALLQKGEVDGAIVQFQKALEINPNDAETYNNLGNALLQMRRVDEAIAQYQRALEINPDYAEAHNNLGNALLQKGQVDEAMTQYLKVVEINPSYAGAHYNLGNAYFRKGLLDEAMIQYQVVIGINPSYADAHYNLGIALLQKGQLNEAIAQLQEAVQLNPHDSEAQNNLAKAQAMVMGKSGQK